ncbi:hypothetical protein ACFJZL_05985 [Enterococcus faecalis]
MKKKSWVFLTVLIVILVGATTFVKYRDSFINEIGYQDISNLINEKKMSFYT